MRGLALLLALVGIPLAGAHVSASAGDLVPASAADEDAERSVIHDAVGAAITARDFKALSAMEDDFRASRARTSSGVWKLAVFHTYLQSILGADLSEENGCRNSQEPFVRAWAAASPRNPAPVITQAALLDTQAWCFRGNGYASTVAADAWPKFRETIAAAAAELDKHRTFAATDPQFFAEAFDISRAQDDGDKRFAELLAEATRREPLYSYTYANAAWSLLPQWGGSYEAVEAFARGADEQVRDQEGGLYARIYWKLDDCGCHITRHADWTMFARSMDDLYRRFPTRHNAARIAELYCRHGDTSTGKRYLRAMHPEAVDENSFAALFATCETQARQG